MRDQEYGEGGQSLVTLTGFEGINVEFPLRADIPST